MSNVLIERKSRISQGDIYKKVEYLEYAIEKINIMEISKIEFPYVIVLTQDCDLNEDYNTRWSRKKKKDQDKKLISVIVAPLYNAEHVYIGEHLSELGMKMGIINKGKSPGNNLKLNKNPRYHYLVFPENISIVPSVIDFKHYFTVNVEYLKKHKKGNFICQIKPLYREDISQRFSSYLSRIGLP
jgi:hypothetical protein